MRPMRNISGNELAMRLRQFGYEIVRQKGSHLRLTTKQKGEHHVTVPLHSTLSIGTLAGIIDDVAGHFGMTKEEVIDRLFEK